MSRLPWNRDKSVAGTVAFVVCGGLGAVALAWWTRPAVAPLPSMTFTIAAPLAAALAAALVETIPIRLDDNVSVPAAAVVLWLGSLMSFGSIDATRAAVLAALPWAIGVNALTGWLGYRARTVSRSGAIGGALVGAIIYAGAGGRAWALLFVTFLAASVVSRLGLQRKVMLGIAEDRGGRRGAGNAVANCGVAALAAIAAVDDALHVAGDARARRGADRRRQRHGGQRDRQGVGAIDVSRDEVRPREAGHAWRDVARGHGRGARRGVRAGAPSVSRWV